METRTLEERVRQLAWYHTIELAPGVVSSGMFDWRPFIDAFDLGDVKGRTALDVGAGDGFFSFELERRGAEVTALDIPHQAERDGVAAMEPLRFGERHAAPAADEDRAVPEVVRFDEKFELAHAARGSQVKRVRQDLYTLSPERPGRFDLVFCNDVLLHLTDPLRALARMRSVCGGRIVVGTPIVRTPEGAGDVALAQFRGHMGKGTFWFPNRRGLVALLEAAGFRRVRFVTTLEKDARTRDLRRGIAHGFVD